MQFRYRAQDLEGASVDGTMEEGTAYRVRQKLEERGLKVLAVERTDRPAGLIRVSERLTWEELELLSRQLAALVRHGLPLPQSLGAMARDAGGARLRPVLERMRQDLEQGHALEEAVARQHNVFPRFFAPLLRAGESAGNLGGVLQMLATYTGAEVRARHALRAALAYPLATLAFTLLIIGFILTWLIPQFEEIFDTFGGQLPALTAFLFRVSTAATDSAGMFLGLAAIAGIGIVVLALRGVRGDTARYWLDAIWLRVPGFGRLHYHTSVARFARTLGILLESRAPVLDSLELAAAASDSALLEKAVEEAALRVAAGEGISDGLGASGFFDHQFCWMTGVGEARGDLLNALGACAEMAEREAGIRGGQLRTMLPYAFVLATGALIFLVILAVYLPIFSLGNQITGL